MAFETPAPPEGELPSVAGILDNHAQVERRPVPTLQDALALGEKYATWWKGSRASHFACDCETIAAGAPI